MAKKFSVSEITELIKTRLEGDFPDICVEGEVSNYKPSQAGHIYFSLKDSGAVISCVMFKGSLRGRRFDLKDGVLLRVNGRLSVYAPRGGYQIVCDNMELAGEGDILLILEKRKRALAEEGLFDEERKKALPRFPSSVAVITAKTGAVIHDIITTLERRAPNMRVVLMPTTVQGENAAASITARIREANFWNKQALWQPVDLLIVGRGGGSVEDLLPFSDEAVVRAVSESEIPVVSAVGHDTDWALCDYASDLRAATPTAAAELVSEDWLGIADNIRLFRETITDNLYAKIDRIKLFLKPFSREELAFRFGLILQPHIQRLDGAKEALISSFREKTAALHRRIELSRTLLEAASPLAIMERGYSVVTFSSGESGSAGKLVKEANAVKKGDSLKVQLFKGSLEALVTNKSLPP